MKKHTRKLMTLLTLAMVVAAFAVSASAEGVTVTPVTSADFKTVIDAIGDQISVSTIVAVLGTVVASSVGLVFMWWGVRKVSRAVMGAFRKGKLSV